MVLPASSVHQTQTPTKTQKKSGHSLSDFCKSLTWNIKKRISEKARPPISDLKYRTCVKQKKVPIFCGLTFHNKYIDAGQKCISVSANCLQQQANELSTVDVEGKCEQAGRNFIDNCSSVLHGQCLLCYVFCFDFLTLLQFECEFEF